MNEQPPRRIDPADATRRLVLRPATPADAALLADMHTRSRAMAYRGQVPDDYLDRVMPAASLPSWQAKLPELAATAGAVLIAEAGGQPAGFVCMRAPDERASVYIDNLHAMPTHRGSGVGTTLLAAVADWARMRGARRMHLKVLESNAAAIGFYESRGWRAVDRVHDAWGNVPIVALVYERVLEPVAAA